jgi:hypothetical protein
MQQVDRSLRGRTIFASIFVIIAVAAAWNAAGGKDVALSRVFRAEPTRDPDEPTEGEDSAHDIKRQYDYSESMVYPNIAYPNLQDTQRYISDEIVYGGALLCL